MEHSDKQNKLPISTFELEDRQSSKSLTEKIETVIDVSSFYGRFLKSQFVQSMVLILVGVAAYKSTSLRQVVHTIQEGTSSFPVTVAVTTAFASWIYAFVSVIRNCKAILYEISIWNTVAWSRFNPQKPWYNQVTDGLYLGAQPMLNFEHHRSLPTLGVNSILTMVELEHEAGLSLFTEPVKPADWEKLGIVQKIIDTPDFLPVSQEKIDEAVEFIHNTITQGQNVYVHCKAGRGRSATAVVCYLLKYGVTHEGRRKEFKDIDSAIAYVREKRPVINLNPKQYKAVEIYFDDLQKKKKYS